MHLRIVSTEWILNEDVHKVFLPTVSWRLGILPKHMNVVTPLSAGDLSYIPSKAPTSALDEFADHTERIQIPGGLAMIENDMVTVIVE